MSKLTAIAFVLAATTAPFSTQAAAAPQTEVESIEKEIELLQSQLHNLRKDAFNNEMQAQPYMFDNWSEYTSEIKANEDDEKAILIIKAKIQQLNTRKQELLKDLHKEP